MVKKALALVFVCAAAAGLIRGGGSFFGKRPVTKSDTAEDFMLLDQNGVAHDLYRLADARAILITSYPRGPASLKTVTEIMTDFANSEAGRGSVVFLIDAGGSAPQDDGIPVLMDEAQIISRALGLEKAPETVVIVPGERWKIAHRGSPDGAIRALGGDVAKALSVTEEPIPYVEDEKLTYIEDIAPILRERCLWCHREGFFPPENLNGYARVREWSAMIRETVRKKLMPPWKADQRYGDFLNDAGMNAEEVRKLVSWIESGMARGKGPDPLAAPDESRRTPGKKRKGKKTPVEADLVLTVPRQKKIPAEGFGRYQYFPVGKPFVEDVWIQAIRLETDTPAQLHHGSMIVVPPELVANLEQGLKEAGLMANSMSGKVVKNLVWAPGKPQVFRFPPRTALRIKKGSRIVLELHYTGIGRETVDRARLKLFFHKNPSKVKPLQTLLMRNHELSIPPYAKDFSVRTPDVVLERDIMATTYLPHMHMRGRSIRTTAYYPDGTSEVLVSVPRYDFNWQKGFVLRVPKFLPKGTRLVTEGRYDNSPQNPNNPDPAAAVKWGHRSDDNEMCNMNISYFFAD